MKLLTEDEEIELMRRNCEILLEMQTVIKRSSKVIEAARTYHAAISAHDKQFLTTYKELGAALDDYDHEIADIVRNPDNVVPFQKANK